MTSQNKLYEMKSVPYYNIHPLSHIKTRVPPHQYFFPVKPIGNHGCCPPPLLPPTVALGHPFKCKAPGRHVTGNPRCAFFGEIQARGGGMHQFLMLVNTTIYFKISSPPPNLIVPIMIKSRSPCAPRRLCILSYPSLLCVIIGRQPSKATMYFIFDFFFIQFDAWNKETTPPTRSALVTSPLQYPPDR